MTEDNKGRRMKYPHEVTRNVHIKLYDVKDSDDFVHFSHLVLMEGLGVAEMFCRMMKEYIRQHPINFTLLGQRETLDRLKEDGFYTNHVSLKKYRDMDVLNDADGNRAWFTDGTNYSYNYEAVRDFVARRMNNRYKRLEEEETSKAA